MLFSVVFTSTMFSAAETIRTVRDGEAQEATSTFIQLRVIVSSGELL